jgi:hypothetical protein
MSSQRTRFACLSCTRRKVKCSKTVPCSNCIRRYDPSVLRHALCETDALQREEQDTCSSDLLTHGPLQSHNANLVNSPPDSVANQHELNSLRSRVFQLEGELQRRHSTLTQSPRTDVRLPPTNLEDIDGDEDGRFDNNETPAPAGNDGVIQSSDSADPVTRDAASVLEFLAWGRRKNPDYNSVISPEASANAGASLGDIRDAEPDASFLNGTNDTSQTALLQLLLPSKKQLLDLVSYHEECLLWYHCSYYAPAFRSQVTLFYDRFGGVIESRGVNFQWLALLFAILTGSITCAPNQTALAWGFRIREREVLSRKWFRAVSTCLHAAEYAANQSILSVQAISTLTISAHLLGFSNIHSIHLAAVIRVAQGLGLHRINDESPGTAVDKESGRRLWGQLCSQDWFSIPFSDTYLINPLYSSSDQPMNCHDRDMLALPESVPTITSYCRLLTRIASIMPQLQDDLMSCNTPYTRFEQVVKWDKQMRVLSTAERPPFLLNIPIDPSWPLYIPWARRSLAISSSHKIIMIHRSFLSESFTNPAFSFTRRTCLAASKTIIKEYKLAIDDEEPVLWIHQAFSVAAAIILILDAIHRSPTESEYREHKQLAEHTVEILRQCENSMIATRGVKLLSALLQEISGSNKNTTRKRCHDGSHPYENHNTDSTRSRSDFSVPTFVKLFCHQRQSIAAALPSGSQGFTEISSSISETELASTRADMPQLTVGSLDSFRGGDFGPDASYFPPGLEGATAFENLLYLANHDFI